jgi:hypothetical protein
MTSVRLAPFSLMRFFVCSLKKSPGKPAGRFSSLLVSPKAKPTLANAEVAVAAARSPPRLLGHDWPDPGAAATPRCWTEVEVSFAMQIAQDGSFVLSAQRALEPGTVDRLTVCDINHVGSFLAGLARPFFFPLFQIGHA